MCRYVCCLSLCFAHLHTNISHCLLLTVCHRGGDGLRCGGALARERSAASLGACRYGDSLRLGWRNVLDCVIRLHRLGLLPPSVVLLEASEPEAGKLALPRAPASRRTASATSIISRAFSRRDTLPHPPCDTL